MTGANRNAGVLVGRPGLHDADFLEVDRPKCSPLASPGVAALRDREAERHATEITALRECDYVSAGRRVGHVEAKNEPALVLVQPKRARFGAP